MAPFDKDVLPRNAIAEKILDGVEDLPAIPPTMGHILQTSKNPDASAEDLAGVISLDPAVTAAVLRVANSPFYGQIGRISDLGRAIVTIGFSEISNLVLSIGVFDLAKKMGGGSLDPMKFWEHSLACAILSQQMARDNGQVSGGEAFMGGLLHDIGKLVFHRSDPARYGRVLGEARKAVRFSRDLEREHYEINHAILGETFARRWNLPEVVRFAVVYHHTPTTAESVDVRRATLVRIVHLSDLFVRGMCLGNSGDILVEDFSLRMLALMRLSSAQIDRAIAETREQLRRLKETLGMRVKPAPKNDARPLVVVTAEDYNTVNMPFLTLSSDVRFEVILALSWGQVVEQVEAVSKAEAPRRVAVVVESRRKASESLFLSTALASERLARIPIVFVGLKGSAIENPRQCLVVDKPYNGDRLIEGVHELVV